MKFKADLLTCDLMPNDDGNITLTFLVPKDFWDKTGGITGSKGQKTFINCPNILTPAYGKMHYILRNFISYLIEPKFCLLELPLVFMFAHFMTGFIQGLL